MADLCEGCKKQTLSVYAAKLQLKDGAAMNTVQWIKLLPAISHVRVVIQVPTLPLPVQLPAHETGKAEEGSLIASASVRARWSCRFLAPTRPGSTMEAIGAVNQ